jgi:hypothetical protein
LKKAFLWLEANTYRRNCRFRQIQRLRHRSVRSQVVGNTGDQIAYRAKF